MGKKTKTNPQTRKRAGISNIYRPNKQTNKQKLTEENQKKEKKNTVFLQQFLPPIHPRV